MNENLKPLLIIAGTATLVVAVGAAALLSNHPTSVVAAQHDGRGGSVWGADYFPNVPLTTHDGREVRFFDDLIADKVVAVNFIYTTCPDACPMETARLLEVQEILGDRMGRDVFFYSISIDPEYDTQPVLEKFVEDWEIGPGWTFLTGREEDITRLRKKLGVYIEEIQGPDSRDHNLSLVIGNQSTGRWMRRSPFENAYVLAKQIGGELHNWKMPSTVDSSRDYSRAPKLRNISKGESLFRTRCEACHTIGDGDVVELAARRIGPDLYKITEIRDRQWLRRWLAEPDVMLEEKDPLALSLLARYNNVPMPNMQLNEFEVDAILEHIEEASAQVAKHVAKGHRRDPLAPQSADGGSMDHEAHAMDHSTMDHGDHTMDHGDHGNDAHATHG